MGKERINEGDKDPELLCSTNADILHEELYLKLWLLNSNRKVIKGYME